MTLTGTVNLYQDKLNAAKKIKKLADVSRSSQRHRGRGKNRSRWPTRDRNWRRQLAYDRVGYYDNTFNYLAVEVKDGVVTLRGDTMWDLPEDSALAIVAHTPGVKDVVNDVTVLPDSLFDDSLRRKTARAIYGDSILGRYATDPVHPIRIVVDNGHVTLYGSVESTMDKTIAGMRAGSVPGAFSVDNKLVVD